MNTVDALLCAGCALTLGLTSLERNPDPDRPVAVALISGSLALGIGARALRNAGYVDTQTIYLLNPVMDALITWWAIQRFRASPRLWLNLLKITGYCSLAASVAYGIGAKTHETKYLYAVVLNAFLVMGLCSIGGRGARDGCLALAAFVDRLRLAGVVGARAR